MSSVLPITNAFLSDKDVRIRAKQIPWEGYQRAGLLTAEDVALIQRISSSSPALNTSSESILAAEGDTYAALYVRLLSKLSRNDTLQYITVLLGDMLHDHDERVALFLTGPESPYTPLQKLLDSPDQYLGLKSSILLSTFLASDPHPPSPVISKLLAHLSALLTNKEDPEGQDVAVQCLEGVLRKKEVRLAAWNGTEIVTGLADLMKSTPGSQMQYQIVFCFWLLTFEPEIAAGINAKCQLIPLLLVTARNAIKEKVLRISLSTFRNLVVVAPDANLPAMLVAKVLEFVESLKGRKWGDEEVEEDTEFLRVTLRESFEGLTTYDEYVQELETGALSWTPPHKSDDFWLNNASKLVLKDREMLKKLVALLMSPTASPLVLAVAANDVAQFAKYHEVGKKALEDLGAKARCMQLMEHADPEVRYESLVAVQRLVGVPYA